MEKYWQKNVKPKEMEKQADFTLFFFHFFRIRLYFAARLWA